MTGFFWMLALAAVLIAFASGCRTRVEYLPHEGQVIHLQEGQAAPWEGYLLSPSRLAELYELARSKVEVEGDQGDEAGEADPGR